MRQRLYAGLRVLALRRRLELVSARSHAKVGEAVLLPGSISRDHACPSEVSRTPAVIARSPERSPVWSADHEPGVAPALLPSCRATAREVGSDCLTRRAVARPLRCGSAR